MTWHTVNAYTSRHQDDYLLEVVSGWPERLGDLPLYFIRHWQDGPHVSVRINAPAEEFQEELGPALVEEATDWLQERGPESRAVNEAHLLEHAARHGKEHVKEHIPAGTVTLATQGDGPEGGPEMAGTRSLYHDYLVGSHRHILDGVGLNAAHGRMQVAFDALVAAQKSLHGETPLFFVAYRAAVDGFMIDQENPEMTREFFERSYQEGREGLRARLRAVLDDADDDLASWGRAATPRLRHFRDRAARALAAGEVKPPSDRHVPRERLAERAHHTDFDSAIQRSALAETLGSTPDWQAYRVALDFLHADLVRVGLTGIERFLTCYFVSRAVDEELNLDTAAALEQLTSEAPYAAEAPS